MTSWIQEDFHTSTSVFVGKDNLALGFYKPQQPQDIIVLLFKLSLL